MAQGVPGSLRPWIFLTFGTTRVVGRQSNALAAFTPGEIPGTHFQRSSRSQGTRFRWGEPWKKSPVTPPGIDPRTVWLVAQCLNHYATPGPFVSITPWPSLTSISWQYFTSALYNFKYHTYPNISQPLLTPSKFRKLPIQNMFNFVCYFLDQL